MSRKDSTMTDTDIRTDLTPGTVINPGRITLIRSDEQGQWVGLTPESTVVDVNIADAVTTGDHIEPDLLIARLASGQGWSQRRLEAAQEQAQTLTTTIDAIRDYAIEKHRDGSICRSGLDEFLAHFEFASCEQRFSVPVTVTATFEITAENETAARSRVRYLIDGIAFSGGTDADNLDVETGDIQVDDAEPA
jgi:hypothetical protein